MLLNAIKQRKYKSIKNIEKTDNERNMPYA